MPKQSSAKSQLINVNKTIPVKSGPLLILEDTCSQETCKSEQAYLSQTSDSFICNSLKQDALNRLLSFSENGNGEKCTTTCTKEARIIKVTKSRVTLSQQLRQYIIYDWKIWHWEGDW